MFGLGNKKGPQDGEPAAAERGGRRVPGAETATAADPAADRAARMERLLSTLDAAAGERIATERAAGRPPGEIARVAGEAVQAHFRAGGVTLSVLELRNHVNRLLGAAAPAAASTPAPTPAPATAPRPAPSATTAAPPRPTPMPPRQPASPPAAAGQKPEKTLTADVTVMPTSDPARQATRARIDSAKRTLQPILLRRMDVAAAAELPRHELELQLDDLVRDVLTEAKIQLNRAEQTELITILLDDMMGLGPIEPLIRDETVTDILINGPKQTYVERRGKLELTEVVFDDNAHLMNICNRIVSKVGRRVDESSPIADARLLDGSRVNIIIPPLALDGASVSIRKFSKKSIGFEQMATQGNMSPQMATVLRIASRCRLNVVISGGTGSGKTTLLNALSGMIGHDERVVTIEDAAELRLQQPHVVRLETRPANLEGGGAISMRDLVKNALRMRPERIILGEVRGAEAVDLLQAMNTGHDGSMGTLHANRPREALTRLENMLAMANLNIPNKAMRNQIAGAVHLIVQISRMRDGMRRLTHITEITGMEGDVITTQDLFTYEFKGEGPDGKLLGTFKSSGLRPHFLPKAQYYGLDRTLMEAMG